METGSLFGSETDTILSGVIFLWTSGSWPLAVIVFIASIAVPFSKLGALTYLLVSVQRRSTWAPRERTRLYRVLEIVGRWSMIDIYVAAILTALVQFGGLMSIRAGPGAIAFGAVVVLTMFAAESFDPRLIWDGGEEPRRKNMADAPRAPELPDLPEAVLGAQAALGAAAHLDHPDRGGARRRLARRESDPRARARRSRSASRPAKAWKPARRRSSTRTSTSAW